MRIALIQMPAWGIDFPGLAIPLLSAVLQKEGHEVSCFDFNIQFFNKISSPPMFELSNLDFWTNRKKTQELFNRYFDFWGEKLKRVTAGNPSVIGFSVQSASVLFSLYFAERIKKVSPYMEIIFGGPACYPHYGSEFLVQSQFFDEVLLGEGEISLPLFLNQLNAGAAISSPGRLLKSGGQIELSGKPPLLKNLDELPFPDFSSFNLTEFKVSNILPILSSRGCVNKCVFCNERIQNIGFRFRSGASLFREVIFQIEKHPQVNSFSFQDSLVNGSPRELEIFADLLMDYPKKIMWEGQAIIRPEMTTTFCEKLKQSGCVCLAYGIESASNRILQLMNKRITSQEAEEVIRNTSAAGISVRANFMFGFPGEEEEDFQATLDFVERNYMFINSVNPAREFFIFRDTPMYHNPLQFGVDLAQGTEYWQTLDGKNNYLVRLNKHKRFCELATRLGIELNTTFSEEMYSACEQNYLTSLHP